MPTAALTATIQIGDGVPADGADLDAGADDQRISGAANQLKQPALPTVWHSVEASAVRNA